MNERKLFDSGEIAVRLLSSVVRVWSDEWVMDRGTWIRNKTRREPVRSEFRGTSIYVGRSEDSLAKDLLRPASSIPRRTHDRTFSSSLLSSHSSLTSLLLRIVISFSFTYLFILIFNSRRFVVIVLSGFVETMGKTNLIQTTRISEREIFDSEIDEK